MTFVIKLTQNKAEILRLFFTNPEKSFYMQEIGRIMGKKVGVFQRSLNNMVSEGILKSEPRANAKYFWINKKYPFYKELKNIIFKTVGIQGSLQKVLDKLEKIEFAFIYGSFAKDQEHFLSDIDLMVIGDPNEDILILELDKLEAQLRREINYHLYSLKRMKTDVKNKNPFILEVLKDKKIMLIGTENELRRISKE